MTEFFLEYGLFLIKSITLVVSIIVTVAVVVAISAKAKQRSGDGEIEVKYLNDEFEAYQQVLEEHILDRHELKRLHKERKEQEKSRDKADEKRAKLKSSESETASNSDSSDSSDKESDVKSSDEKSRLYVIDFDGDIRASQADHLAKEITALLTMATPEDEVLIRLESPGGVVHGYGLAASQLERLRKKGIAFTVAVDKVAASGGYMMACLADKIIAAPFAILGSIGVLAQMPNFHRLLKKHDIDYEVLTAGEFKRTMTVFGENSDKGRKKFMEELEETHQLFKSHVSEYRSVVDIDKIATGEHWFGRQALELKLVDELMTSDEYLVNRSKDAHIYQISYELKKPLIERLSGGMQGAVERAFERILVRLQQRYL